MELKKYTCRYISGGGTEYNGGIWTIKEAPKLIIFTCIKKSFYECNWSKLIIHKDTTKEHHCCLRDNEDGSYTVYPEQCGTPHIFELIKKEAKKK